MIGNTRKRNSESETTLAPTGKVAAVCDPAVEYATSKLLSAQPVTPVATFLPLQTLVQAKPALKTSPNYSYQYYLQRYSRLLAIEPSLDSELPEENFIEAYEEAFDKVNEIQSDEINWFKNFHHMPTDAFHIENEDTLSPLERLERRSHILDSINADIISQNIRQGETSLSLNQKGLTRFPSKLFETNREYWTKLEALFLIENKIRSLPQAMDKCKALRALNLYKNKLAHLPTVITHCQALENLIISKNKLTFLPESIGNCVNLKSLTLDDNNVAYLPESLSECRSLRQILCNNNNIKSLPDKLVEKIGDEWAIRVLRNQQSSIYHYYMCN